MNALGDRLDHAIKAAGLSEAEVARRAGIRQPSVNAITQGRTKQTRYVLELARATGVNPDWLRSGAEPMRAVNGASGAGDGLRENDAEAFEGAPEARAGLDRLVAALAPGRKNAHPWLVKTQALDLAGFLPGDVAVVDLDVITPEPGQIVIAQVYDWDAMTARTVMRVFEPPYLVAHSSNPAFRKPELVDGERVIIKGTVIALVRSADLAA